MAERRGLTPTRLFVPPPVSEAIPVRIPPVQIPPLQCAMSAVAPAVMAEELEATRQQRRKKHTEQAVVAADSSESPRPPVTPDSKVEFPAPVTPETLTWTAVAAGKGRKREKHELAGASLLVEEALRKEEKNKRKRSNQEVVAAATPSPSIPAAAAADGAAARKVRRLRKLEHGQSVDVHPQGGEAATNGGVGGSKSVRRRSSSKPRVLSNKQMLRMRIQELRENPKLPQGFLPFSAFFDQDPKYSSPCGAFFEQFCYKPERRQGRNAPRLPKTPYPPARLPPQDHPSIRSSQPTANEAFMVAKSRTSNRKQPPSASDPQEEVNVKGKKRPEKEMSGVMKTKKKAPLLSASEKRSDKYRRLPLDQLVPAPRSHHRLLQEEYADDPWKVILICLMLNQTRGSQVKKILKGFFTRYPDAQTASTADLKEMAEYLAPLGLQHVKAKGIQRLSKDYVKEEWTYITELYGVGKYGADAYAIFCAGRAAEVVPEDHKLVDYWKYVCPPELVAEALKNAEAAASVESRICPRLQERQGNFALEVQRIA